MNVYAVEGQDHDDLISDTQVAVIEVEANLYN
jgi:hypothetical protein